MMRTSTALRKASSEYSATVQELVRDIEVPIALQRVYQSFEAGFGFSPVGLALLLNREHWLVERPEIGVFAQINQSGNLVVRWMAYRDPSSIEPTPIQFDVNLHRHYEFIYADARPYNELMWVHNIGSHQANVRNPKLRLLAQSIYSGIVSRYYEIIDQIKGELFVRYHTPLSIVVNEEADQICLIAEPR